MIIKTLTTFERKIKQFIIRNYIINSNKNIEWKSNRLTFLDRHIDNKRET